MERAGGGRARCTGTESARPARCAPRAVPGAAPPRSFFPPPRRRPAAGTPSRGGGAAARRPRHRAGLLRPPAALSRTMRGGDAGQHPRRRQVERGRLLPLLSCAILACCVEVAALRDFSGTRRYGAYGGREARPGERRA